MYTPDPESKWERKLYDEGILEGKTNQQRAEIETARDLGKPIEQLLCDVIEETHSGESTAANIATAQKRMASLIARVAISNERAAKRMEILTWAIGIMTLIILLLTYCHR